MYFFIDESGHSGHNLFDANQPRLLYGVLSSPLDLDREAAPILQLLSKKYGFEELHAAEQGVGGLIKLAPALTRMQRDLAVSFDLYSVAKIDHAIICFFDQVFDSGMNEGVSWIHYWTPLRYLYLLALAKLFDIDLAQRAWQARINTKTHEVLPEVTDICRVLLERVRHLPDARAREILSAALSWAAACPEKLDYNVPDREMGRLISPNIIGFQAVLSGIAKRCRDSSTAGARVTADRQSQFNSGQKSITDIFRKLSVVPLKLPKGMPQVELEHLPDLPLQIADSSESPGLQIADVFLWLYQRFHVRQQPWPVEFAAFERRNGVRGLYDEISLRAIARRWLPELNAIPEPTQEDLEAGRRLRDQADADRKLALAKLAPR